MSQTLTPAQHEMVKALYPQAEELRYKGLAANEILKELEKQGAERSIAQAVMNRLYKKPDQAGREAAIAAMLVGLGLLSVGLIVTVGTYTLSSGRGGFTILAYGAIGAGAIRFFSALYDYIKS